MKHEVVVRGVRSDKPLGYEARCSCSWVGPFRHYRHKAEADAAKHEAEEK